MATFWKAPSVNFFSTTLNGAITDSDTTVTLTSVTGLQAPGVLIIDREDGNGNATASSREVITFTGISSNDLTGVSRNVDGSGAKAHSDGALVEATVTVGLWNDLRTAVAAALGTDGTTLHLTGTASIATGVIANAVTATLIASSAASITTADIPTITSDSLTGATLGLTSLASVANMHYGAGKGTLTTDSDGATVTFNMNLSNIHTVTLGGNRTLAVSNVAVGQAFIIRLVQDGTGSRTVTWFSTIKWVDGTAPTLTTTASKADVFGFICTSSGNYDGFVIGQNL